MVEHTTATASISAEEVLEVARDGDAIHAAELVANLAGEHNAWHEHSLNLVASHNLLSPRAKAIMQSNLIENHTSGGIGARNHSGSILLDRIESMLVELAKKLFGVPYVEHRAPSGALSNGLFMFGAMEPGDRVIALPLKYGGHYTYLEGSYAGVMGLEISEMPCHGDDYPIINLELLAEQAEWVKPRWMIVGSATLLFPYPLKEMERIAQGVGAKIVYDGAHILGLAAGGQFQSPLGEGARVMTGSTQKTLAGPVGGLILMHDPEVAERVTRKTSSFLSSYNNSRTAALVVTLAELLAFGKQYASAVVGNAQHLARSLDAEGFTVAGKDRGFTTSHIVLVDLGTASDAVESLQRLEAAHISGSLAHLPRAYPDKTVLRLGSPTCTRKGMGEREMREVAKLMRRTLLDREEPARVGRDVEDLVSAFNTIHYCF